VISAVACICLSLLSITGAGVIFLSPALSTEITKFSDATPTRPTIPTTTPSAPEPGTAEATPGGSLPPEVSSQMDAIEQQVIDMRELEPEQSVSRVLMSPEELHERVVNDFFKEYTTEDAKDEAIELGAFGLLDPDFDLYQLYIDLYTEQVAGFYDDDENAMYVIRGEGFTAIERMTYAHEYVHALQDQNFDFDEELNFNEEDCEEDAERCTAVRALLEGDASMLELQWLYTYATAEDFTAIQDYYGSLDFPVFDNAPEFLKDSFTFPYDSGTAFVQSLLGTGGLEAIDQAFQDPPVTTEQILHPERYPDDQPIPVTLPDLGPVLGEGWREINRQIMGEFATYLILAKGRDPSARIDEEVARVAAEGWGGDAYAVYANDQDGSSALVMTTVWDRNSDADQFAEAFNQFASARFGNPALDEGGVTTWQSNEGYTEFHHSEGTTTWIFAPNAETAAELWRLVSQ